ncbi:chemotaxis protein CheW [Candidatus Competibacter phosphatis]|uniref:chemotaxis protein CheW n=1 Tax=Candidatus Competibacter phosphatis TaxID=221280 RepID=UPI0028AA21E8|nr:chemotaxis protein CheW [Candidatus Competibacter phosphatis]
MADVHTTRRMDEAEEKDHLMQLVGFMNGKEMFGVDILMVQEIIRGAPITAVPNTPAFVEGVTNLRGNIIPVIDLRRRLSLPTDREKSGKNWVLILDIAGRVTGFVVDAVTEVLKIERDSIEPPPEIVVAGLESQYVQGGLRYWRTLAYPARFQSYSAGGGNQAAQGSEHGRTTFEWFGGIIARNERRGVGQWVYAFWLLTILR